MHTNDTNSIRIVSIRFDIDIASEQEVNPCPAHMFGEKRAGLRWSPVDGCRLCRLTQEWREIAGSTAVAPEFLVMVVAPEEPDGDDVENDGCAEQCDETSDDHVARPFSDRQRGGNNERYKERQD